MIEDKEAFISKTVNNMKDSYAKLMLEHGEDLSGPTPRLDVLFMVIAEQLWEQKKN